MIKFLMSNGERMGRGLLLFIALSPLHALRPDLQELQNPLSCFVWKSYFACIETNMKSLHVCCYCYVLSYYWFLLWSSITSVNLHDDCAQCSSLHNVTLTLATVLDALGSGNLHVETLFHAASPKPVAALDFCCSACISVTADDSLSCCLSGQWRRQ